MSSVAGVNKRGTDESVASEDADEEFLDEDDAEADPLDYESLSDVGAEEDANAGIWTGTIHPLTSTWRPRGDNMVARSDQGWLNITLGAGEDVTLIGQYEFRVISGIVTVGGAFFSKSSRGYKVFAPSTHSLPVIQSSPDNAARIELRPSDRSICKLLQLSPLFQKIWNHPLWPKPEGLREARCRGFSYISTSKDDPLKRALVPLELDSSWASVLSSVSNVTADQERLVTLVCGARITGKSTFCRFLLNRTITGRPQSSGSQTALSASTVCYLDLDPGQAEFTPSAQISLVLVTEPVLGPPYSHCSSKDSSFIRILRAHSVCSTSEKEDIHHFLACVVDLYQHYKKLSAIKDVGPLIVNTPGSIFGSGLEALLQILPLIRPDHVVYILPRNITSQNRSDFDEYRYAIEDAVAVYRGRIFGLVAPEASSKSRANAQLRDMQSMSYFHSRLDRSNRAIWEASPISADRSNFVKLRYRHEESTATPGGGGEKSEMASILGVASMGREPPPGQLATIIDGNILGAVYIEDDEALALISSSLKDAQDPSPAIPHLSAQSTSQLLQPSKSQLLGLVFVQGMTETEFIVHSPNATYLRQSCASGRVILVHRDVPAPGWAYKEPVHMARRWRTKDRAGAEARGQASGRPVRPDGASTAQGSSVEGWDDDLEVRDIKWVSLGRKRNLTAGAGDMSASQLAQDLGSKRWRGVPRGSGV